jgi:hypothetical protein
MNRKNIPSDRTASLGGGVVRLFSDYRRSPNILYVGDRINGALITGFTTGEREWVNAETRDGIFAATFSAFYRGT